MPRTFEDWLRINGSDHELFRCELTLGIKAKFNASELRDISAITPFNLTAADYPSREMLSQAMLQCLLEPTTSSTTTRPTTSSTTTRPATPSTTTRPAAPQPMPTTAATQAMLVATAFQKLVNDDPSQISPNILILNRIEHVLDRLSNIEKRLNTLHVPDKKDVSKLQKLMRRMNEDYAIWDADKVESILRAASDNPGHMQALRDIFKKLDDCVPILH